MNLLAIDTSSINCSVALTAKNDIHHLLEPGATIHAQRLLAIIDQLLSNANTTIADINVLICGVGPGSFTGLRVGVGVAQGLAYSAGLKVLGVNSLLGYLSPDLEPGNYAIGADARMGQLYNAGFTIGDDSSVVETTATNVCNPQDVNEIYGEKHVLIGAGWDEYRKDLPDFIRDSMKISKDIQVSENDLSPAKGSQLELPNSKYLLQWAMTKLDNGELPIKAEQLAPFYVRNNVADKPKAIS